MMKKRAAASILIMAMLVSQFSFASGKESLKKDTGKSKESTAVSQEQIQAERELEDEKQALLREEEGYNSQYLVWHGTEQPDVEALENYARQSFAKAKSQKAKKIQAVEGKIKDAREKKEFAAQLERNGAKLESREIAQAEIDDHMLEGYDRIRLPFLQLLLLPIPHFPILPASHPLPVGILLWHLRLLLPQAP